jgi:hypothetical protein
MSLIERYVSNQDYTELTDKQGEIVDWVATDFRDGEQSKYNPHKFRMEFAKYDPMQIKIMAMIERERKIRRWLIISFVFGIISILSWWALWH